MTEFSITKTDEELGVRIVLTGGSLQHDEEVESIFLIPDYSEYVRITIDLIKLRYSSSFLIKTLQQFNSTYSSNNLVYLVDYKILWQATSLRMLLGFSCGVTVYDNDELEALEAQQQSNLCKPALSAYLPCSQTCWGQTPGHFHCPDCLQVRSGSSLSCSTAFNSIFSLQDHHLHTHKVALDERLKLEPRCAHQPVVLVEDNYFAATGSGSIVKEMFCCKCGCYCGFESEYFD